MSKVLKNWIIAIFTLLIAVAVGAAVVLGVGVSAEPMTAEKPESGNTSKEYTEDVKRIADEDVFTMRGTRSQMMNIWRQAINASTTYNKTVKVVLGADWTADTTNYSFGAQNGVGFDNFRILIPANARVILDLNGYSINKGLYQAIKAKADEVLAAQIAAGFPGLTDRQTYYDPWNDFGKWTRYGSVMYVKGYLELQDSSSAQTGWIGGGWSEVVETTGRFWFMPDTDSINNKTTGNGGGILVEGGTLKMLSGTVKENCAVTGGGICVYGGTFEMWGGILENNHAFQNSGTLYGYGTILAVTNAARFDMYGGDLRNGSYITMQYNPYPEADGRYKQAKSFEGGHVCINSIGTIPQDVTWRMLMSADRYYTIKKVKGQTGQTVFNFYGGEIHNMLGGTMCQFSGGGLRVPDYKREDFDYLSSATYADFTFYTEEIYVTPLEGGNGIPDLYQRQGSDAGITPEDHERLTPYTVCNMYGGKIYGAEGGSGGGTNLFKGPVFNMYGGEIFGCSSDSGAGMYISGGGSNRFNMYGGEIHDNIGTRSSGAIQGGGNDDFVTFYGGVIRNNICGYNTSYGYAGGIYLSGSKYRFAGPVQIYDNYNYHGDPTGDSATVENIFLNTDNDNLYITGALVKNGNAAKLGITLRGNTVRTFTKDYSTYNNNDPSVYFFADNGNAVEKSGNEVATTDVPVTLGALSWYYKEESTDGWQQLKTGVFNYDGSRIDFTYGEHQIYAVMAQTTAGKRYYWYGGNANTGADAFSSFSLISYNNGTAELNRPDVLKDAGNYAFAVNMPNISNPSLVIDIKQIVVEMDEFTWNIPNGGSFTYNGEAQSPTATVKKYDGLKAVFNVSGGNSTVVNGKESAVNAGEYTAVMDTLSDQNYTFNAINGIPRRDFSVVPKEVGVTWGETEFTYDGTAHAPTATADNGGINDGSQLALSVMGAMREAYTEDGLGYTAYVSGISGKGSENYTIPLDGTDVWFKINRRPISIFVDDKTCVFGNYGSVEYTWDYVEGSNELVNDGTAITLTSTHQTAGATAGSVGVYNIVPELTGNAARNYILEYTNERGEEKTGAGILTVTSATISATNGIQGYSGIYDGAEHDAVISSDLKTADGSAITYRYQVSGSDDSNVYTSEMPKFRNATENSITVLYIAAAENHTPYLGSFTVSISPLPVTVEWDSTELVYTGKAQTVAASVSNRIGNDDVRFTYDDTRGEITAKDVKEGGYHAYISGLDGADKDNYVLGEDTEKRDVAWNITPAPLTVIISTINTSAYYLGPERAVKVRNWYRMDVGEADGTNVLVGEDAGKDVTDLFTVNLDDLVPAFFKEGDVNAELLREVKALGRFNISFFVPPANTTLYGNANYTVTVRPGTSSGVLTVEAAQTIAINTDSPYDFMKLDVNGNRRYRRTYKELNIKHGTDDVEQDSFVLGQVSPRTKIAEFISNFVEGQEINIKLYNQRDQLVYDGADTENPVKNATASVGTGWYIDYSGKEKIYISVLGDLNGDGTIAAVDITTVRRIIKSANQTADYAEHVLLSAYINNRGTINATDITVIRRFIKNTASTSDYFYKAA